MTPRYLIPADAIPGLLDGWTGPATLPDGDPVVGLPGEHWGGRTLCGDGVLRHYTERSIRLDPARPEVAHRIADVLRSLGHEVGHLLPVALGGRVGDAVEETTCGACGGVGVVVVGQAAETCARCSGTGKLRRPVPASEASAKLLAASVAGVVAGRGVVRGVLGRWYGADHCGWHRRADDLSIEIGDDGWVIVGGILPNGDQEVLASGPETGLAGRAAADAAALALGWALLSPDAPSGVVVPTWGQP